MRVSAPGHHCPWRVPTAEGSPGGKRGRRCRAPPAHASGKGLALNVATTSPGWNLGVSGHLQAIGLPELARTAQTPREKGL